MHDEGEEIVSFVAKWLITLRCLAFGVFLVASVATSFASDNETNTIVMTSTWQTNQSTFSHQT